MTDAKSFMRNRFVSKADLAFTGTRTANAISVRIRGKWFSPIRLAGAFTAILTAAIGIGFYGEAKAQPNITISTDATSGVSMGFPFTSFNFTLTRDGPTTNSLPVTIEVNKSGTGADKIIVANEAGARLTVSKTDTAADGDGLSYVVSIPATKESVTSRLSLTGGLAATDSVAIGVAVDNSPATYSAVNQSISVSVSDNKVNVPTAAKPVVTISGSDSIVAGSTRQNEAFVSVEAFPAPAEDLTVKLRVADAGSILRGSGNNAAGDQTITIAGGDSTETRIYSTMPTVASKGSFTVQILEDPAYLLPSDRTKSTATVDVLASAPANRPHVALDAQRSTGRTLNEYNLDLRNNTHEIDEGSIIRIYGNSKLSDDANSYVSAAVPKGLLLSVQQEKGEFLKSKNPAGIYRTHALELLESHEFTQTTGKELRIQNSNRERTPILVLETKNDGVNNSDGSISVRIVNSSDYVYVRGPGYIGGGINFSSRTVNFKMRNVNPVISISHPTGAVSEGSPLEFTVTSNVDVPAGYEVAYSISDPENAVYSADRTGTVVFADGGRTVAKAVRLVPNAIYADASVTVSLRGSNALPDDSDWVYDVDSNNDDITVTVNNTVVKPVLSIGEISDVSSPNAAMVTVNSDIALRNVPVFFTVEDTTYSFYNASDTIKPAMMDFVWNSADYSASFMVATRDDPSANSGTITVSLDDNAAYTTASDSRTFTVTHSSPDYAGAPGTITKSSVPADTTANSFKINFGGYTSMGEYCVALRVDRGLELIQSMASSISHSSGGGTRKTNNVFEVLTGHDSDQITVTAVNGAGGEVRITMLDGDANCSPNGMTKTATKAAQNQSVSHTFGTPVAPLPALTISSVFESAVPGTSVPFTVTAVPPPASPIMLSVAASDKTRSSLMVSPSMLTIDADGSAKGFVETSALLLNEGDQLGNLTLQIPADAGKYTRTTPSLVLPFRETGNSMPTDLVLESTVSPVMEGGSVRFTIRENSTPPQFPDADLSVKVTVSELTGSARGDFVAAGYERSHYLRYPPNAARIHFDVPTVQDRDDELDGVVKAVLEVQPGYTVNGRSGGTDTAYAVVLDNDGNDPEMVTVHVYEEETGGFEVPTVEMGDMVYFEFRRTGTGPLTIGYELTDPNDVSAVSAGDKTVSLLAGETSKRVPVLTDQIGNGLSVRIRNARELHTATYRPGNPATVSVEVVKDLPNVSIASAAGDHHGMGTGITTGFPFTSFEFTLTREVPTTEPLHVTVEVTKSGTGADKVAVSNEAGARLTVSKTDTTVVGDTLSYVVTIPAESSTATARLSLTGDIATTDMVAIGVEVKHTPMTYRALNESITVTVSKSAVTMATVPVVTLEGAKTVRKSDNQATVVLQAHPIPTSALTVMVEIAQTGSILDETRIEKGVLVNATGRQEWTIPAGSSTYLHNFRMDGTGTEGTITAELVENAAYAMPSDESKSSIAIDVSSASSLRSEVALDAFRSFGIRDPKTFGSIIRPQDGTIAEGDAIEIFVVSRGQDLNDYDGATVPNGLLLSVEQSGGNFLKSTNPAGIHRTAPIELIYPASEADRVQRSNQERPHSIRIETTNDGIVNDANDVITVKILRSSEYIFDGAPGYYDSDVFVQSGGPDVSVGYRTLKYTVTNVKPVMSISFNGEDVDEGDTVEFKVTSNAHLPPGYEVDYTITDPSDAVAATSGKVVFTDGGRTATGTIPIDEHSIITDTTLTVSLPYDPDGNYEVNSNESSITVNLRNITPIVSLLTDYTSVSSTDYFDFTVRLNWELTSDRLAVALDPSYTDDSDGMAYDPRAVLSVNGTTLTGNPPTVDFVRGEREKTVRVSFGSNFNTDSVASMSAMIGLGTDILYSPNTTNSSIDVTVVDGASLPTMNVSAPASVNEGADIAVLASASAAAGTETGGAHKSYRVPVIARDSGTVTGYYSSISGSPIAITNPDTSGSMDADSNATMVSTNGDQTFRGNGEITIEILPGEGYKLGTATARVHVAEDDGLILRIGNAEGIEGTDNSNPGSVDFTVELIDPSTGMRAMHRDRKRVSATWTVSKETGDTADISDFVLNSGNLPENEVEIASGSEFATFSVPLIGDNENEVNETFTVALSGLEVDNAPVTDATVRLANDIAGRQAKGRIVNDDLALTITSEAASGGATIGRNFTFTVIATPAPIEELEVGLELGGTGISINPAVVTLTDTDYRYTTDLAGGKVTIPTNAGGTDGRVEVTVSTAKTSPASGDRTFTAKVSDGYTHIRNATDYEISVELKDNSGPTATRPNVSVTAGTATVAANAGYDAEFTIVADIGAADRAADRSPGNITARYELSASDYIEAGYRLDRTAVITAGDWIQNATSGHFEFKVSVPLQDPAGNADPDTITLTLFDGRGYALADDNDADVNVDDDAVLVSIEQSSTGAATKEGDPGDTTTIMFGISLDKAPADTVKVDWAVNSSAAVGADFVGDAFPSNTVEFTTTDWSSKMALVPIAVDAVNETHETFTVELRTVKDTNDNEITDGSVVLHKDESSMDHQIQNDDAAIISMTGIMKDEGTPAQSNTEADTDFNFTVSMSKSIPQDLTVNWTFNEVDTDQNDYKDDTVPANSIASFAGSATPITTSRNVTIPITVSADSDPELNEDFSVTLSGLSIMDGRVQFATPADATTAAPLADSLTVTGTIQNDDAEPIAIRAKTSAKVVEGATGSNPIVYVIEAPEQSKAFDVQWRVVSDTTGDNPATAADFVDHDSMPATFPSGTVSFTVDMNDQNDRTDAMKEFSVNVLGDGTAEFDETYIVELHQVSGDAVTDNLVALSTSDNSIEGTILDDDALILKFAPASLQVLGAEGHDPDNPNDITFTVELIDPSTGMRAAHPDNKVVSATWTVDSVSADGDTADKEDFVQEAGVTNLADFEFPDEEIDIASGNMHKTFGVEILGDIDPEVDDSFTVTLSGLELDNAAPDASVRLERDSNNRKATGTILNDDIVLTMTTDAPAGGVTAGNTFSFTVTSTPPPAADMRVKVGLAGTGLTGATVAAAGTDADFRESGQNYGYVTILSNDGASESSTTLNVDTVVPATAGDKTFTAEVSDDHSLIRHATNYGISVTLKNNSAPTASRPRISVFTGSETVAVNAGHDAEFTVLADIGSTDRIANLSPGNITVRYKLSASGYIQTGYGLDRTVIVMASDWIENNDGDFEFKVAVPLQDPPGDAEEGTITLTLMDGQGYMLAVDDPANDSDPTPEATATVDDNALFASIAQSATGTSTEEGDTTVEFAITLSGQPDSDVWVDWSVSGTDDSGYADADADDFVDADNDPQTAAVFPSGIAKFEGSDGSSALTIAAMVQIAEDSDNEPHEAFTVNLSNLRMADGTSITDNSVVIHESNGSVSHQILNDEPVIVGIEDVSAFEGSNGSVSDDFTFMVSLEDPIMNDPLAVNWQFAAVDTDGSDFEPGFVITATGSVNFRAGSNQMQPIRIPVLSDSTPEPDQNFTVKLTGFHPNDGRVKFADDVVATGTIRNDDGSAVSLAAKDMTLYPELANGKTQLIPFRISVATPQSSAFDVVWEVISTGVGAGHADGSDFVGGSTSGMGPILTDTASFTISGSSTETERFVDFNVPVMGDDDQEPDETFTVRLTGLRGAAATAGTVHLDDSQTVKATIHTDDGALIGITKGNYVAEKLRLNFPTMGTGSTAEYCVAVRITGDTGMLADVNPFEAPSGSQNSRLVVESGVHTHYFLSTLSSTAPFTDMVVNVDSGSSGMLNFSILDGASVANSCPGRHSTTGAVLETADQGTGTAYHADFANRSVTHTFGASLRTVSIGPMSGAEDSSGSNGSITFPVALSSAITDKSLTMTWTAELVDTGDEDKADRQDFVDLVLARGTVTISQTRTNPDPGTEPVVQILLDSIPEPDEIFKVTLSDLRYSDGTSTDGEVVFANGDSTIAAKGTITNNDGYGISVEDQEIVEGDSGEANMSFTVKLSDDAPAGGVAFTWSTTDGTAVSSPAASADFIAVPNDKEDGMDVISADDREVVVNVPVKSDTTPEENEVFTVTINPTVSSIVESDLTAVGTILNDDSLVLSVEDGMVTEGADGATTKLMFAVKLTEEAPAGGVAFTWSTTDGTAISTPVGAKDFTARTNVSDMIAEGSDEKVIEVDVIDDNRAEFNETFTVTIASSAMGVTVVNGTATGTIVEDDDGLALSVEGGQTVGEGNPGNAMPAVLNYNVKLNKPAPAGGVTFDWATSGTATSGEDYTATGGVGVSIAAGSSELVLTVDITADVEGEQDETVTVTISNGLAVTADTAVPIIDASATGTILNDDGIGVSIASLTLAEGTSAAGTKFNFKVTLTHAPAQPVKVNWETVSTNGYNAASPGVDFLPVTNGSAQVTGKTATLTVSVTADAETEFDETFLVRVTDVTGASEKFVGIPTEAVGTIENDDQVGTELVGIVPTEHNIIEGPETSTADFTIRSNKPGSTSNVRYTVSQTGDFIFYPVRNTIQLDGSSTSLSIPIIDNLTYEAEGRASITVTLRANESDDFVIEHTKGSATVNIANDDPLEGRSGYSVAGIVIVKILEDQQGERGEQKTHTEGRLSQLPAVSITAETEFIEEGGTAVFNLSASIPAEGELSVNIALTDIGNFIGGSTSRTAIIAVGNVTGVLKAATSNDRIAESDGSITASLIEGDGYEIGLARSAKVIVTDNEDRDARRSKITAGSRIVFSELAGSSVARSLDTATQRATSAFSEGNGIGFQLGGNISLTDFIRAGGDIINGNKVDSWQEVLGKTSFEFGLFPEEGYANPVNVWGYGDFRELTASSSSARKLDGDIFTGHLGFDTLVGEDMVAGLSMSISKSELDYGTNNNEALNYNIKTTGMHPYLGLESSDGSRLQVIAGYGLGGIELDQEGYQTEMLNSSYASLGASGNHVLYTNDSQFPNGNSKLTLEGETWFASQFISSESYVIGNIRTDARHLRISTVGSHKHETESGMTINPSVSLGLREDGKHRQSFFGMEMTGDIGFADPHGYEISTKGEVLLSGTDRIQEWGVSGRFSYDAGSDDLGMQMDVNPEWGRNMLISDNALWGESTLARNFDSSLHTTGARINAEVGYGITIPESFGVLNPYGSVFLSETEEDNFSVGTKLKFGSDIAFGLEGSRTNEDAGTKEIEINFEGRIKW